jgi:hypothetical protein
MRIKDARQGLHTLLQTQDLDGLMLLCKRLEKPGRALLLCLLCAEASWQILLIVWLRLERAYLGRSALRGCIIPIAALRPTKLRRTGVIPSTASIF